MSSQREKSLRRVEDDGVFDVLVVGGGINGIGVYRDLALQGLRVLLIERNDFCSACSSAPSRMIHGGLRYLENGELGLVKESLRERDALLVNAPHMVRPLATTIPIRTMFSGLLNGAMSFLGVSSRPANRGALAIKMGLVIYDLITRTRRLLPEHTFHSARETLRRWPRLSPDLKYSATYYDAWISYPERLGLEMLLDIGRDAPDCVALNYAEVVAQGDAFVVTDRATGRTRGIRAAAVVNATGAWIDEAYPLLSGHQKPAQPFVSGTKGSHLVVDSKELCDALGGHMVLFEHDDGRVCVVFPYLGKVLAGATDIRVDHVDRVRCEPEERDYILGAVRSVFPTIDIAAEDVVFGYSGIRPLPRSDHSFTGRISRGHEVRQMSGTVPQFCMIGGKWTTFRAFAEQTADAVMAHLGRPRRRSTFEVPIGGGAGYGSAPAMIDAIARQYGVTPARAEHLVDLYGSRAHDVLAFCSRRIDDMPVHASVVFTRAEIAFTVHNEHVEKLSDVLLRRTPLSIRGDVSMAIVHAVAAVIATELNWSDERRQREIETFVAELSNYHNVPPDTLTLRSELEDAA